ncbi:MAG: hypothetical protein JKY20_05230 [Alphaproteobacteria bacterium]|nr:hypothetical protein [Alphaproteobacteria bacterium]
MKPAPDRRADYGFLAVAAFFLILAGASSTMAQSLASKVTVDPAELARIES